MDEITTVSGPIFHLEVFRIANLRYETSCAVMCTLLADCEDLWRTHCNKTGYVLKRSVSASCRFKFYGKRLISFGDTSWNVKLFLWVLFWITEFTGRSQALFSLPELKTTLERIFCEFFSVKNQIKKVLYSMSPKITIFCSKCEAQRSSDWLRLPKKDTWHPSTVAYWV